MSKAKKKVKITKIFDKLEHHKSRGVTFFRKNRTNIYWDMTLVTKSVIAKLIL